MSDGSLPDRSFSWAIVESLPGIVYLYDRNGRFLKWNRNFARASGYAPEEIARMQPLDFVHGDDRLLVAARIGDVFASGATSVEARLLRKDGVATPYYFTGDRITLDGEECLIGMGLDISERVRTEQRLSERLKELAALQGAASVLREGDEPVDQVLHRLAGLLPPAFRFPELAAAAVEYAGVRAATDGFSASPWMLASGFSTSDGAEGMLQAAYRRGPPGDVTPPFLKEEHDLLVSVADLARIHFERRIADNARREGVSLLQMAQRVARLGAWAVDLQQGRPIWSDEVRAIHEVPPGFEPTLDQAIAFYAPEHQPLLRNAVSACIDTGEPFELELRLRTAAGRWRWVRAAGEVVRDANGATVRVQGALQDITARRHAQDEARRLSTQIAETLESISDAFFTLDREWRFTFLNREAQLQLSRSRETLLGRVVWEEYPELLGTVFESSYRRAMEQDETVEFESWFASLGAWFSVRAYPSPQGVAVYFHNITRQREAREQARINEERFQLLARATNDAIWDWNLETDALWWNEGLQTLFGYEPGDVETIEGWSSRVHPEDRDRVVEGIHRAIDSGGDAWKDEYRFLRRDGEAAYVMDRGYIIHDADGQPIRMIGGITDLTERKKLEAQFLRAQRLESIGTLAGGIAHDLNNILAPIMMATGLLKAEETEPDKVSLLETIETSGRRGADMVRQVLGFARGVEGRRAPVNLNHLFRDVQQILRDTMPKNVDVRFEADRDLWIVLADPTQIHQVLMNLCVNARDAMPRGGSLRVTAKNLMLDELYSGMLASVPPGPYVLVSAADTGMGMSRETQERVFEPFFTTKEIGKGTGLGLSTVLTIVRSHGGAVDVYSEPGAGTTFKVYLPADTGTIASTTVPEEVPLPRGNSELILVVDDEENIRVLARKTLERYGYAVLEASHGAEAVALFAQYRHIAAVLTDMAMPVMDGHATILALKAIDPEVRIIASSGQSANDAHDRATGAGVARFITKPYTTEAIVRTVHDVLSMH